MHAGYSKEVVAALSSQELDMALQDRVARETSDAKNALEGYVYNMRDSLSTRLAPYEKEDVRAAFSKELDGVEVCVTQSCLACLSNLSCCHSARNSCHNARNSCLSAVVHVHMQSHADACCVRRRLDARGFASVVRPVLEKLTPKLTPCAFRPLRPERLIYASSPRNGCTQMEKM